ncbi:unnamed protein product, partial [Laminaria digitata]
FNQQRRRQQQEREEEGKWRPAAGGWAASALSEFDQLAKGDWPQQLDSVLATVSDKVDKAVQSLDETINDVFGGDHDNTNHNLTTASSSGNPSLSPVPSHSKTPSNPAGRRVLNDGWVEIRGGNPTPAAAAFLDPLEGHNKGIADGKETVPVDGRSAGAGGVP